MLHKNMNYPLGPWPMGRSKLPTCYFLFRMEFTQHLDDYEHAKCVELYSWKCYICCVEAKDQVGLEMQHIGDGVVYTDGIDGSKWICCQNARKPITWNVSLKIKKEKSSSPFFALLMNVEDLGGRGLVKRVIKQVTILTLFSVGPRQKTTAKKIRREKD